MWILINKEAVNIKDIKSIEVKPTTNGYYVLVTFKTETTWDGGNTTRQITRRIYGKTHKTEEEAVEIMDNLLKHINKVESELPSINI